MLPDITEYYNNDSDCFSEDQYKRKSLPEVIGECYLCGALLDTECEIVMDANNTFCSEEHMKKFEQMEKDGEV